MGEGEGNDITRLETLATQARCNNDRLFSREISGADYFGSWKYTVKDHISNTKLEKGDQTWHKDLCS